VSTRLSTSAVERRMPAPRCSVHGCTSQAPKPDPRVWPGTRIMLPRRGTAQDLPLATNPSFAADLEEIERVYRTL